MIRARRLFLDGGDYDPLRAAILQRLPADPVLDVGCGEGYYSRPLASRTQWVGGIDLSKYAVRIAARRERRVNYAVANAFDLPIVTGSIGSIINVFGPVAQTELRRVLRRGGRILAAGPGPNHLIELKQVALDDVALHPLRGPLGLETFRVVDRQRITYEILVRQPELNALLTMTPYRWRTTPRRASAVAQIQEMTITADFLLYTYIS